jgi:hypothetical protein
VCQRVHGHHRGGELRDATEHGTAVVAESDGRIVAYASSIAFFGHAVGETSRALQALPAAATEQINSGGIAPRNTNERYSPSARQVAGDDGGSMVVAADS